MTFPHIVLVLVLVGMRYLRKGLDRRFGSQLVDWLQKMTRNRVQGFRYAIARSGHPSETPVVSAFNREDFEGDDGLTSSKPTQAL